MPLDVEARFREAVQYVWTGRLKAKEKQAEAGRIDVGTRSEVTGGGHMGALELLVVDVLVEAGIRRSDIFTRKSLELPGYYRPEKRWDLLVVSGRSFVMALEFQSMVGSFGKNLNNRIEEAVGSATDIWTAYREGRFGTGPPPFLGYFSLLQDHPDIHKATAFKQPHFPVDTEFLEASYGRRFELLLRRLVLQRLYNSACLTLATHENPTTITAPAEDLAFRRFVSAIRGQVLAFLGGRPPDSAG